MKVLIVGLGSMGKRRVRNLKALGVEQISGFDIREDRRNDASSLYGIPTFGNFEDAIAQGPDAIVISLPPDLHVEYAHKAIDARVPFFTEASVVPEGMAQMVDRLRASHVLGVPSCTMRYFPGPKLLKRTMNSGVVGRPLAWTYQSGQYLPDWHPWERMEAFYVSKRKTGGCREIVCFELVWLVEVFGGVRNVSCQRGKLSDLPVDIDDIYQLQLAHESGVFGQLTVDVLARPAVRLIRVTCTEGTIEWNAASKLVRTYSAREGSWVEEKLGAGTVENGYTNPEEPYIKEMDDFLGCVREYREPAYTFEQDCAVLSLLQSAETSSDLGVRIAFAPTDQVTCQ